MMESSVDVKSVIDEITILGQKVSKDTANESEEDRQALRAAAKKLGFALEVPFETLQRLAFLAS